MPKLTYCWTTSLRIALLASIALPLPALAQQPSAAPENILDEIIVTATKREERLQDVPLPITAISGDGLEQRGATELQDLIGRAAGLALTRTGPSNNRVAIRGLTGLVGNVSEYPVVSTYLDDVPIAEGFVPDVGLLDLARVEVLRGPQGTLYGEGAMGGTLRFVTNRPDTDEFSGNVVGEVSSIRGGGTNYRTTGVLNAPLAADVAALRVSGFYERNGGFITNVARGKENADSFRRYGGRAALLVTPTDKLSISLTGIYQRLNAQSSPTIFPVFIAGATPSLLTASQASPTTGYQQVDPISRESLYIANGTINYDFDFATLTSSTSYYKRSRNFLGDETQTSRTVERNLTPLTNIPLAAGGSFGFIRNIITNAGLYGPFIVRNGTQVSENSGTESFAQEVRLASNGDTRLKYTLGAYYRTRNVFSDVDTVAPDIIPLQRALQPFGLAGISAIPGQLQATTADVRYRQYAVFGEATFEVIDNFEITGGLRYLNERIQAVNSITAINGSSPSPTFLTTTKTAFPSATTKQDDLLYKIGGAFKLSGDALVYLQMANGVRPGGLNERANPAVSDSVSPRNFESDSLKTYEVGAKTSWLDGKLVANLAAYITDWKNIQFSDSRDPQFPVIRNAASARIKGVELELTARPTRAFEVGATVSYTDARFNKDALLQTSGVFLIINDQRVPVTPNWAFSTYAQLTQPLSDTLSLVAYADLRHIDKRPANTIRTETASGPGRAYDLPGYVEANVQIGVETDRFAVTAFVDNVTDEFAQLGGAPAPGISRNQPRTVGLRGRVNF
jgi:iron complex outermembrane recepter protein